MLVDNGDQERPVCWMFEDWPLHSMGQGKYIRFSLVHRAKLECLMNFGIDRIDFNMQFDGLQFEEQP